MCVCGGGGGGERERRDCLLEDGIGTDRKKELCV